MTSTTPPMRTRNIQDTPIQMAGIFTTEASAHATLNPLLHVPGMTPQQVRVLGPQDANKRTRELFGRRTEQFEKVAQDVMMPAHLMSGGIIGAVLGAILYFWLTRRGMPSLLSNPLGAFATLFGGSTFIGIVLGSVIATQPPRANMRAKMMSSVRAALMHDNWAVIVRPSSRVQTDLARQVLGRHADEVHRAW